MPDKPDRRGAPLKDKPVDAGPERTSERTPERTSERLGNFRNGDEPLGRVKPDEALRRRDR